MSASSKWPKCLQGIFLSIAGQTHFLIKQCLRNWIFDFLHSHLWIPRWWVEATDFFGSNFLYFIWTLVRRIKGHILYIKNSINVIMSLKFNLATFSYGNLSLVAVISRDLCIWVHAFIFVDIFRLLLIILALMTHIVWYSFPHWWFNLSST